MGAFIFSTVPNADVQRCFAEHLIISPLQSNWHARGDRLSALQVYRLSRIYPPNIQLLLTSAFDALLRGFGSLSMSGLPPCVFLVYIACSVPQLVWLIGRNIGILSVGSVLFEILTLRMPINWIEIGAKR